MPPPWRHSVTGGRPKESLLLVRLSSAVETAPAPEVPTALHNAQSTWCVGKKRRVT